jgi:hypothetical protein
MQGLVRIVLAATVVCLLQPLPADAAACSKDDFAQAVDRAGVALRALNAENTPRLKAKMRQLKENRGWQDVGYEERALEALADERIAAFDAQANDLLAKIDTLGTSGPSDEGDCAKLQELTAASLELQATVKAKAAYTLSKLEQMLAGPEIALSAEPKPDSKADTKSDAKPEAKADAKTKAVETRKQHPPVVAQTPAKSAAKAPDETAWATQTEQGVGPQREASIAEPSTGPQTVPPLTREEEGYSIQEILAASQGVFGKVSANLGSVIEHLFANSGRPSGYVLGAEGGGAFLAGVRYGKGVLYLRSGSTQKVYWHGPSLGTDVGAEGSKTLFLIYRLNDPGQLYANFTGIDGSAYVVGGAGVTLFTNGTVIMAPIRSGLGLRLGANIGYIRFTPKPTWNPF